VYSWVDHTAEVELAIAADQEWEVFGDALRALAELLGIDADAGGRERREIAAIGPDRPALLAAWLEELVFLAETTG
jgi:SHS2 domain-containing protein